MADRPEDRETRSLNEVTTGTIKGPASLADSGILSTDLLPGTFVDWRTIDPSTIEGTNVPVEELQTYRENIDELLRSHQGQYVLIVGREIIAYFEDFESAAKHAEREFRGRSLLVKKVAQFQQVHRIGGMMD